MTTGEKSRRAEILPGWFWLAAAAILVFLLALATTSQTFAVTFPLAALLLTSGVLIETLWRRRRGAVPWFEIGVVYASVVTLYGVYPLVRVLVVGQTITPQNDSRWAALSPTMAEVGQIGWFYVSHLVAFVVVYLLVRGRLAFAVRRLQPPSRATFIAVIVMYATIASFWFFLGLFYDTSAGSYAETYLVARRLPLFLAQSLNHLNGAKYPLSLVILAALFARYPASRPVILGWVGLIGVVTVSRLGSRTEFALLVMSSAIMYHTLIRPISVRVAAAGVVGGVTFFLVFGMIRSGWLLTPDYQGFNPFLLPSEFDVLFATPIDLTRLAEQGTLGPVPPALYLADLAALVPQQLAPFEKIEPAAWYVWTYFPEYAATGGGLAFGTMAEAALSGGWVSAAVRGAALGFCFAKIHRFYVHHADRYWVFVFYVWATTLSYQCFRASTFFLLVLFVYRFLPAMIGVKILATVLTRAAKQTKWGMQFHAAAAGR